MNFHFTESSDAERNSRQVLGRIEPNNFGKHGDVNQNKFY